jgi:hypothetical protein
MRTYHLKTRKVLIRKGLGADKTPQPCFFLLHKSSQCSGSKEVRSNKCSKNPCRSKNSSSSKETVKHFLISSVKALLLWWLPPFDPLYLTSFVLRAIMPNLPYTDQRGGWKLTKLNRTGLYAYEEITVLLPPQPYPPFYAACWRRSIVLIILIVSPPVTLLFRSEAFLP